MNSWRDERIRIKGIWVKRENYERKLRRLHRLVGTRTCVRLSWGRGVVVHGASRMLKPPSGRQIYHRITFSTDCGADPQCMVEERGGPVTCKKCLSSRRGRNR